MNYNFKISYYDQFECQLDVSNSFYTQIREHFSYYNEKYGFSRNPYEPRRFYNIDMKGRCPIQFVWVILKYIKDTNLPIFADIDQKILDILKNKINLEIEDVPNEKFELRYYQTDAIERAFKYGNGICHLATNGGKSLIMASILQTLYKNNPDFFGIVVVPNLSLIEQLYKDFTEYGCEFSFSKWSGKCPLDNTTNIIIVNTGLIQRFTSEKIDEYSYIFKRASVLLYDEVHLFETTSDSKSSNIIKKFEYKHKFGFTGSLLNDCYVTNRIKSFFGPVIFVKKSKELIDEGFSSKLKVKLIKFNHKYKLEEVYDFNNKSSIENYQSEVDYLCNSKFRTETLQKLTGKLNNNCLILIDKLDLGVKLLENLGELQGKNVFFIEGDTPLAIREQYINLMETTDNCICIAMTKIFSVGISIKNINYIFFYNLGKSPYKLIQSVGRGLRKHFNKKILAIFDMYDNMIYSEKHIETRKTIYNDEQIKYEMIELWE